MRVKLAEVAASLDVRVDEAGLDRLMVLRGLWLSQGRAINLVGATDDATLLPHIADGIATIACAARAGCLTSDTRWLDIGSGGGLPGLVVAALVPCTIALVEPRQRRAAFLEFALASIHGCGHGRVFRARLGDVTWDKNRLEIDKMGREGLFDVATSRAVFAPRAWLEAGDNLVKDGGVLIAHLHVDGDAPCEEAIVGEARWGASRICGYRRTRAARPLGGGSSSMREG